MAGAKIQLVWEYLSHSFAHLALVAGTIPDNKYIDTVVRLAQRGALFLFDLGYFKVACPGPDCRGRGVFSHAPQPSNSALYRRGRAVAPRGVAPAGFDGESRALARAPGLPRGR